MANPKFKYDQLLTYLKRGRGGKKSIMRDCILYLDGEDLVIDFKQFQHWVEPKDPKGRWTKHVIQVPLARVSPDNIMTLLYTSEPDMTVCNRLTTLTGYPVYRDKRGHRNFEHHVRIAYYERYRPNNVRVEGDTTVPYFAGLQIDMNKPSRHDIINRKTDIRKVVKHESIKQVKDKFNTLRKLALVSAKMGSLSAVAKQILQHGRWSANRTEGPGEARDLYPLINFADPTFADVELLFNFGVKHCERPNRHHYVNGQWVAIPDDEVNAKYAESAITYALRELRKHHYEVNDGHEFKAA